jgi:hypothetical protein
VKKLKIIIDFYFFIIYNYKYKEESIVQVLKNKRSKTMIINNRVILEKDLIGTLCWFWHNNEVNKKIGILADIYVDEEFPEQTTFYELNGGSYTHCEPVKEEHITFYADRDCTTKGYRKAQRELVETVEEYLNDAKEQYIDEIPNYEIAMEQDNVHCACGESDEVVEAIRKLMEQM